MAINLLDHFFKLLLLVFPQVLVVFDRGDIELMLSFRLGRLERAGEDGDFDVTQNLDQERS